MINLLEEKKPAAIIAVTGKHPMCGLNPYPLFEDGNFQIPSGYVSVSNLKKIKETIIGKNVSVHITSNCIETKSKQIIANKSVKKTLSIPAWLNTLAEKENVNFSQILQSALKDYLKIDDKKKLHDINI